jgi:hypothetical protein
MIVTQERTDLFSPGMSIHNPNVGGSIPTPRYQPSGMIFKAFRLAGDARHERSRFGCNARFATKSGTLRIHAFFTPDKAAAPRAAVICHPAFLCQRDME